MKSFGFILLFAAALGLGSTTWAAHPLITDDTGTQGSGKYQVEVNGELTADKETEVGVSVESTGLAFGATIAAGVREDLDIILGIPFILYEVKVDGTTVADENGPGDVVIEAKWRFYTKEEFSLAFKPGISLPTGDEDKDLGTGETGFHLFVIATTEAEPFTVHGNVGYIRYENNEGMEKDLWHLSVAGEYEVAESTRLVANIGIEKNEDPSADNDPAFGLIGVIHSPKENIDLDAGIKIGLTDSEDDLALLVGVAVRF